MDNTKQIVRKITPWKGGRKDRVYARMTPSAKKRLLARVRREGFKTLGDWLDAQAVEAVEHHRAPAAVAGRGKQ